MTHQNVSLGMCWKLFRATLIGLLNVVSSLLCIVNYSGYTGIMQMRFLVSQVRLDFMGCVPPVEKVCLASSRASSTVFAKTEGTRRKLETGRIRGEFSYK